MKLMFAECCLKYMACHLCLPRASGLLCMPRSRIFEEYSCSNLKRHQQLAGYWPFLLLVQCRSD